MAGLNGITCGGRLLVAVGVIAMGVGVAMGQGGGGGGGVFPALPPVVEGDEAGARGALFMDVGVREAIGRGLQEGKVTVVVSRLVRPPAGREAWWGNAAFRRWLAEEAVVVWASPNQRDLLTQVYRGDRGRACSFGGMDVFVDGLHAAGRGGEGGAGGAFDERDLGGAETLSPSVSDRAANIDATSPGVTAEWLMSVIDRQRALGEMRSAVLAHRAAKRREVEAGAAGGEGLPVRPRVFAIKTGGVEAVGDVTPGAGEGWRVVVERWRTAARLEELEPAKAAAELTWLIERATEIEPGAGVLATAAAEKLLAIAQRTQMARTRVEAIVDSTAGVLSLTGQGEGIDGLAMVMLVSGARGVGQAPAMVDEMLSRDDREMLRRSHGRAVLEQVDELRRSGRGEWKKVVSVLERGLEGERPAFVNAARWEALSALRRGLIARAVAEGVWEFSLHARGDGTALEAAERLEVMSRAWPAAERRAALRGIGLAMVLAERSSPVLRDKALAWLEGDAEAASLREAVRGLTREAGR